MERAPGETPKEQFNQELKKAIEENNRKLDEAAVKKIQNAWRKQLKARENKEKDEHKNKDANKKSEEHKSGEVKDDSKKDEEAPGNDEEENNDDKHIIEKLSSEAIEKQIADCLKVIETVISGFDPKDFKDVPGNIETEPETKSGENMRTCFKRLLSGYCRCNGLNNAVKVHRGDLFWKNRDESKEMSQGVVKDLLKNNGKAFEKALLEKINPILQEKNKEQVMTKAFASRIWKCIVYYCYNGAFPDVSLLDRKNVFDGIRTDLSNFLKNAGNGDCGVISVLQGKALIDGNEANKDWTPNEIKTLRSKTSGGIPFGKKMKRTKKNGDEMSFLPEDATKWDAYTQRINDLKNKGMASETELLKVAENKRDELERNFATSSLEKRISAIGTKNSYDKSLLPDDFRWFAKACGKTILLIQNGLAEPLVNLCFRDGTQLSDGTAFFENLFTEKDAKEIVCIYQEPLAVDRDDGKNITHYKAFSAKGRKALFDALGYRKDDGTADLKSTFSGKELDLTGGSDADMNVRDVERRMRARILFECDPAGFTKTCFTDIQPKSMKFPSYKTYGEQQTDVLKDLSKTEDDYKTKLQWAPSLTDNELKVLNETFGKEHRYLVKRSAESFVFETVGERIDRWKNQKLYTPNMTDNSVLDWSREPRLEENLRKASDGGDNYFYNLLQQYVEKQGNSWMYDNKVVKTIDVRGLEELVFSETLNYCSYFEYVTREYPGIAFRVSPSFKKAKESRDIKVTVGKHQSDCVARTDEEKKAWDDVNLLELENKRLREFVSVNS